MVSATSNVSYRDKMDQDDPVNAPLTRRENYPRLPGIVKRSPFPWRAGYPIHEVHGRETPYLMASTVSRSAGDAGSDLGGEHSTAEGPKPYLAQTPIIAIRYDDVKKGTGERLEIGGNRGI